MSKSTELVKHVQAGLKERNQTSRPFFAQEAPRLAKVSQQMAERFLQGGRLLAFGKGCYTTDAQHVSVEFVHPVIVGKRALPALDISIAFEPWLNTLLRPQDMVMGFGPPGGDVEVSEALAWAQAGGAFTFSLPGSTGDYAVVSPSAHPFIHQELIEVLYHTLWESVHVFLEHRQLGQSAGEASFLYPFLGERKQDTDAVLTQVATSIEAKATEVETLREKLIEQAEGIAAAVEAIRERLRLGGKIIAMGNGGSATDANDLVLDCIAPPLGWKPIPAISLSWEAANITAIANDVGKEVIFLRQLIAQATEGDVVLAISTSGGSKNLLMALEEARKQKLLTVALLGYDGGEIARQGLCDHAVVVDCDYIPRIQEVQASVYHLMLELLSTPS
jgi:D-sedoheptulose 7-phosphate isomerase